MRDMSSVRSDVLNNDEFMYAVHIGRMYLEFEHNNVSLSFNTVIFRVHNNSILVNWIMLRVHL